MAEALYTFIAGSNRTDATSTKLLRYMARRLTDAGAGVHFFDLRVQPLPFYSPDPGEAPDHPNVSRLLAAVGAADGLVIGSPEYHGSVSGVLKNALDFVGSAHVSGKPVLSVSSSGGAVGVSSLTQLQAIIRNLHGINCPEWISLGGPNRQFGPDGAPVDVKIRERVERALKLFVTLAHRLRPKGDSV